MEPILASLLDAARNTVAQGHLVALASICALQYLAHVYGRRKARRELTKFQDQVVGLECELSVVEKDRTLARYENQILREFLSQTDCERALQLLLRRFAPTPEEGFCAIVESHKNPPIILANRGLTDQSLERLVLDPELATKALDEQVVQLSVSDIQPTQFWTRLAGTDRSKVKQLFLLGLGTVESPVGVIVSTDLFPSGAHRSQQIELAVRLINSLADSLRHKQTLVEQQALLRTTSEMLELRSIGDRRYDSPLKTIEEFLKQLGDKLGADRTALYLTSPEGTPKPLMRVGQQQQASVRDQWQRHEMVVAVAGLQSAEIIRWDRHALEKIGVHSLLGTALTVPLKQPQGRIGVLCVSKAGRDAFRPDQQHLCEWAATYLADSILKALTQAAVEIQAKQDGLTQLANRRTFDQQLVAEMQFARGTGIPCSLLMFDLDRFKQVNDTYGHRAGDQVLRMAGSVLKDQLNKIRAGDRALAARYGGEELAVILPGVGVDGAVRMAEGIRVAIESLPIELPTGVIRVTTSVGVATYPVHADTAENLISAADGALYVAKSSGRNRVGIPTPVVV